MAVAGVQVVRFEPRRRAEWDAFVRRSRNGHFMLERGYLDYHAHRFQDESLLFLRGECLLALLPAHRRGDALISHDGLPFAGLAVGPRTLHRDVKEIFEALRRHLGDNGLRSLVYTPTPHLYHAAPFEDDLYLLHRTGARCTGTKLSAGFPGPAPGCLSAQTAHHLRRVGRKHPCVFRECDDVAAFWSRLEAFLRERHGAKPVHSVEEMTLLKSRFPDRIRLLVAESQGEVVAGLLVYLTDRALRVQYSFRCGRQPPRLLARLCLHAASDPEYRRPWTDFGTSAEPLTGEIDERLLVSKEIMGARGVVVQTWTWEPG
jgi:hypothetical protein